MRFLFGLLIPAALLLASGELSGRRAPGFSIPDMQQQQHDVQDYHGKILVLDIIRTSCPHCAALASECLGAQRLQVFPEERAHVRERAPAGLEMRVPERPGMDHVRPDFEGRADVGFAGG